MSQKIKPICVQDLRKPWIVTGIFSAVFFLFFIWLTIINLGGPQQPQSNVIYILDFFVALSTCIALVYGLRAKRFEYNSDNLLVIEGLISKRKEIVDYSDLEIGPLSPVGYRPRFEMRARSRFQSPQPNNSSLGRHPWTMINYKLRNSDTSIYFWLIGAGARQVEHVEKSEPKQLSRLGWLFGVPHLPRSHRLLIFALFALNVFGWLYATDFGGLYLAKFSLQIGFVIILGALLLLVFVYWKFEGSKSPSWSQNVR